ncbi:MAG: ABC transporter substrate-binding protein, partial [Oscillospiraceae bacterium]|nr:ABC transporter substrate-binding protein [Oscillospiraceae bacterium]
MKKIISIILCAALALTLVSCGAGQEKMRVGFLKGPTGVGSAYLMEKCADKYDFTLEADTSIIMNSFISGSLDIAAVPTNAASVLYNKLGGEVQVAAINTLSVLYILEKGDSITGIADLRGKTILTTGQGANPEYVLKYILRENGLTPDEDVFIEFLDSAELTTRVSAGEAEVAMMPMPSATSALLKNSELRIALSVGDEWEKLAGIPLPQGCIVMRKGLKNVDKFLKDYEESINFMADERNLGEAAALTVKYEIIPNEQVAQSAIPLCGLTFVSGSDIAPLMEPYLGVMLEADPVSVGGKLPENGFYY